MNISELSPEQQVVFYKFIKGDNLFITGPGGTGKTKLIQYLYSYCIQNNKKVQICALTGCASVLLRCNARTIHSWSGIRLAKGTISTIISSVLRNQKTVRLWKHTDILICDEVSMMSKKMLEILDELAKIIRKNNKPFGGMQLIFCGDFYQLPPIGTIGEPSTELFCFESTKWIEIFSISNHIELTTMFRQTDPVYIEILLQIREGRLSEEYKRVLQNYVKREYNPEEHNNCTPTKLFAVRAKSDYVNNMMFSKLETLEYTFAFIQRTDCNMYLDNNKNIPFEIIEKCLKLSPSEIHYETEQLVNNTNCNRLLSLKIGSVVMCTANIELEVGICNGSQGIVTNIIKHGADSYIPIVQFSNGIIRQMQPHFIQSEEYPTIIIGQYPLCLAWAMTIHKIQGATLSLAEMDLGRSIFEYGQTYVALSRIQTLHGLYLSAFHPQKIKANPKVIQFYNSFREQRRNEETNTNNLINETPVEPNHKEETTKKIYADIFTHRNVGYTVSKK